MPDSLRSSISSRRYRLAQACTVAGSIAVGMLVVNRLVGFFREDFFLFYGVSNAQYRELHAAADGHMPLTMGQLSIAALALFTVTFFIASERRRLRQGCDLNQACRRGRSRVVVERLSSASLFDAFVTRTSMFAGLLLSIWLLQSSLERWLGGLGWGMEYADWRSLLPLASVFGVCVLGGMLVSAVSLVGLRAIHVLEHAFARITRRPRRVPVIRRPAFSVLASTRTFRELLGCDILSRPPPMAC